MRERLTKLSRINKDQMFGENINLKDFWGPFSSIINRSEELRERRPWEDKIQGLAAYRLCRDCRDSFSEYFTHVKLGFSVTAAFKLSLVLVNNLSHKLLLVFPFVNGLFTKLSPQENSATQYHLTLCSYRPNKLTI